MGFLGRIIHSVSVVLKAYFPADADLISPEAKEILAHPEDKKKYLDAIDKIRNGSEKETIKLHNNKELTLVS